MLEESDTKNWSVYNRSQVTEKEVFLRLLADLCKEIEEPLYKFGRSALSLRTAVFASALKVYTTFSLRRFVVDMQVAVQKGYLAKDCAYTTVSKYMCDSKMTKALYPLVWLSSIPLRAIETKFAIDSTGLRTTLFTEYCNEAHELKRQHMWVKAHACTGIKTNVITAVEVSLNGQYGDSDTYHLPSLLMTTEKNGFEINEVSADKAYLSSHNFQFIQKMGAVGYIPFKVDTSTEAQPYHSTAWRNAYLEFMEHGEQYMKHYHLRSNVETTFFMIKARFGDFIRSKDKKAQLNEIL